MITKDIANNIHPVDQNVEVPSHETDSVDSIFSAADQKMRTQNSALTVKFRDKKKKSKHPIAKFLIVSFSVIVVLIVAAITVSLLAINASYPAIKESFLSQISVVQSNLFEIDESELTAEQNYQKQVLLLFSAEEIDAMIGSVEDIKNFSQMFEPGGTIDVNMIPENKREEYQKIVEEYQSALQNQENCGQTNTTVSTETEATHENAN